MKTKIQTQKTLWTIDHAHSEILFRIRHLVISTVTGRFGKYDAEAETRGDVFEGAKIHFEAQTDSLDTGSADRDKHLRSAEFFDTAKFPKMTFDSRQVEKTGENTYSVRGDLTIRDTTKEVRLDAVYGGTNTFYGKTHAGFEITGRISRKAFGLTWNALTETGSVIAGDEVHIQCNVQLVRQDA